MSHAEVRSLARVTLTNLILTLLVALFVVIPTGSTLDTGTEMIGSAAASVCLMAPPAVQGVRRRQARTLGVRVLLWRFGLSALAYLALALTGALFLARRFEDALGWLVAVVLTLLVISVRNTWDLLVTVAEGTGSAGAAAGGGR